MIYHTDDSKEFDTDERCSIIEILNKPELEHISVAQARVKPGVTTAWHTLDGDELYYILEGTGVAELGDRFKKELGPGDLLHIQKNTAQRITNTGQADLRFLCICSPRFTEQSYHSLE